MSAVSDSMPGMPLRIGTPSSPNTSLTLSLPLVTCAEEKPHS
jgi:hypothetical protein